MTFGELMKKKRTEVLFLTQEEVSEKLGILQCNYCQYENGKIKPSIKTKRKIIEVLKITNQDLKKVKE